jgi:DMSO reductase anchor subunit
MIQRIQTIFLLIAIFAIGIELTSPLLKSSVSDQAGIYQDGILYIREYMPALIILALALLVILICIFLFKHRKTQKLFVLLSLFIVLAGNLVSGLVFFTPTSTAINLSHAVITPGLGVFMPLIGLISLILAYRGISKDDKIVKSMDRLR